ncbi:MAG: molybdopterin biosynthesis protein MoeA, partial [Actinomycetota bacterium]
MTPLDDVRAHVQSRLPAPVAAEAPFDAVEGLVLASDVPAPEDVPPFDNTAVDGFAVIASDTASAPVVLHITGEMAAGAAHTDTVGPGCAVRIMTGAPLPRGCDAVVMVEDTQDPGDGTVHVMRAVEAGASIRRAGSDVRRGEVPLRAGTVVTPAVQAVLATLNARTVSVWRRPRVGVMSTGDELVDDGSPLGPGQIRESNRTMLLRLVRAAGMEAVDLGIIRDDEDVLEAAVRGAVASG